MYESQEEYKAIVTKEVQQLEKNCRCRIFNGDIGLCPRCGHDGIWDIATRGFIRHQGNSIYYSTVFNEWRCGVCDNPTARIVPLKARPATPSYQREQEAYQRRAH